MKKNVLNCILIFTAAVFFTGCSVTKPRLADSGGSYNSISDDMILASSVNASVKSMAAKLDKSKKIIVVQVVDNDINDYLADRIYEELLLNNFVAGKTTQDDLKTMKTDIFDQFLVFYPVIYGTETAVTRPTLITKAVANALNIFGGVGRHIIANYDYVERQAGVAIHGRLVNAKTGSIVWVEDFLEQDKIRLEGGLLEGITVPEN